MEKNIQEIEDIYQSFDLMVSRPKILDALSSYEHQTAQYLTSSELTTITNYHKNLFLQKTYHFPRAEQLLGEALVVLGDKQEPFFQPWRIRIYISLGHVHKSGCNYIDADAYLNDALNLAHANDNLSEYLPEIYSLLSTVNLFLRRNREAKQFAIKSKEVAFEKYQGNPTDSERAASYAHALVSSCRMSRLIGLIDPSLKLSLREAEDIFTQNKNDKGRHLALLELVELNCALNVVEGTLDLTPALEKFFSAGGMHREEIQAGLVSAKILQKMFSFEQARDKLVQISKAAREHQIDSDILMADIYYEIGMAHYEMNEENQALAHFRKAARLGMVLGMKSVIVRSFKASRSIDKAKASELLTSDLVYDDALFARGRVDRSINPFRESRTRVRVTATTMFVDIVDFTAIMMGSDEDMTVKMVDELIDRICLIIYLHNGYIDKFLGDGVMAIFEHGESNSPTVALNTIKCGLDILRALKHKNYKLKRIYGVDRNIDVRIGISTGIIYAILLGNYIKTEFTYLGNSVNLASKLEQQAANQMMLADDKTHELVHERVMSTPQRVDLHSIGITEAYGIERLKRTHVR